MRTILLGLVILLVGSCATSGGPAKGSWRAGDRAYLAHGVWVGAAAWTPANFEDGEFVPANTAVRIVSIAAPCGVLETEGGRRIELCNDALESGVALDALLARMLGRRPVDVDDSDFAEDIAAGRLRLGMTREEVVLTRGWPSKRRTASLDAGVWEFAYNPWASRRIEFADGRVVAGRGVF